MTTNREFGEKLLKEAEWIFEKDLKVAVEEENYNIAVRRAQEVVELALKAACEYQGLIIRKYMMLDAFFRPKLAKNYISGKAHLKRLNGYQNGLRMQEHLHSMVKKILQKKMQKKLSMMQILYLMK